MSIRGRESRSATRSCASDEHAHSPVPRPAQGIERLGRLRVPLTLVHRPWAALYRYPDGRLLWCLRLWMGERVVARVVSTSTLRRYARSSRLTALEAEIEELLARARRPGRRS
jgi:hypothetical protein